MMRRTAVVQVVLWSLALSACSSLNPFAREVRNKPAELTAFKATAEVRSLWREQLSAADNHVFTPAVAGGGVYAAGADGTLARFDEGKVVWRIQVGQALSGGVGSNGRLVAVGTAKGEVLTFDAANGKPLWQAQVSSEILAAPTVGDGVVIVRSGDARIFAFEANDGKRRWVYQRNTPTLSLRSHVGVVLGGRAILAGFPGGKLVALSPANGGALWEGAVALPKGTTELERVADLTSAPVVYGSQVCAVAYQGRVACFELSNGSLLWSRDVSSVAGLDVDQKGVYVSDEKGTVLAFDRQSGASLWKQDRLSYRGLSRPLAVGHHIIVADRSGIVHLLRQEDGGFAARFETDGSPVLADPQSYQGGAVVQTQDGSLYALSMK